MQLPDNFQTHFYVFPVPGSGIDLYQGIVGQLFVLRKLSGTVLFDDFPDFVHPFDDEHLGIPKFIFHIVTIFSQKGIVFLIKGIIVSSSLARW